MHSVLIRPISSAQGAADSGATKRALMQALSPARDGILVCGVRLAQGGPVVVETTCEASALKILASKALAGVGLVASLPDLRDPEVLLRGVSADSSEKYITEAIYSQNSDLLKGFSRAEFEQQLKLRYRASPKGNELVSWVAAVRPELHERVSKKGHLWVDWRRCAAHSVK